MPWVVQISKTSGGTRVVSDDRLLFRLCCLGVDPGKQEVFSDSAGLVGDCPRGTVKLVVPGKA